MGACILVLLGEVAYILALLVLGEAYMWVLLEVGVCMLALLALVCRQAFLVEVVCTMAF